MDPAPDLGLVHHASVLDSCCFTAILMIQNWSERQQHHFSGTLFTSVRIALGQSENKSNVFSSGAIHVGRFCGQHCYILYVISTPPDNDSEFFFI